MNRRVQSIKTLYLTMSTRRHRSSRSLDLLSLNRWLRIFLRTVAVVVVGQET